MQKSLLLAVTAAASLAAHTAMAEDYLSLSAGVFDISNDETANFGLEYRGDTFWHGLLPVVGAQLNTDGGVYGYVGLNYDWQFTPQWYLTPHAAVGLYDDGSSKDLGGAVQFRTGAEISYRLTNNHRVGLAFHHLSNAGIYDRNPGTEQVMLSYSVPLSAF